MQHFGKQQNTPIEEKKSNQLYLIQRIHRFSLSEGKLDRTFCIKIAHCERVLHGPATYNDFYYPIHAVISKQSILCYS